MDYVRVVYKRRWIALPVFLIVFVVGAVNALRQTPVYQARVQLLIEKDAPKVARLDQMFQSENAWYDDDFYQTQFRILQSRRLAKRTIDSMKLWDAPQLGNGPEPKPAISFTGYLWPGVYRRPSTLAKKPFADPPAPAVATDAREPPTAKPRRSRPASTSSSAASASCRSATAGSSRFATPRPIRSLPPRPRTPWRRRTSSRTWSSSSARRRTRPTGCPIGSPNSGKRSKRARRRCRPTRRRTAPSRSPTARRTSSCSA